MSTIARILLTLTALITILASGVALWFGPFPHLSTSLLNEQYRYTFSGLWGPLFGLFWGIFLLFYFKIWITYRPGKFASLMIILSTAFLGIASFWSLRYYLPQPLYKQVAATLNAYSMTSYQIARAHRHPMANGSDSDEESALPQLKKRFQQINQALDKTLQKASHKYGAPFNEDARQFMAWKQKQAPLLASGQIDNAHDYFQQWMIPLGRYEDILIHDLRQATGIYHLQNKSLATIMAKVPDAEKQLRAHPNDSQLCTVLHDFDPYRAHVSPKKQAQQIAFMRIGNQYCSQYYATKAAWPSVFTRKKLSDINHQQAVEKNPYHGLSYPQYYRAYVIPRIATLTSAVKNKDQIKTLFVCGFVVPDAGLTSLPSPERDAARQVYLNIGKHYCPKKNAENKNYLATGLYCLKQVSRFNTNVDGISIIERCKETPGILFDDHKS